MTHIVATSDLHGNLPDTPECDILIIAGDVSPLSFDRDLDQCMNWLDREFRRWLEAQPAKHIVGIAGNHDFVIERRAKAVEDLELPWRYLQDTETTLEGLKVYGLPWVPNLQGWAFYGSPENLKAAYDIVPDDADIVISHGPPRGVAFMDGGHPEWCSDEVNVMLKRVLPRVLICGHIHEGWGKGEFAGVLCYDVSYVDEFYVPQDRFADILID